MNVVFALCCIFKGQRDRERERDIESEICNQNQKKKLYEKCAHSVRIVERQRNVCHIE